MADALAETHRRYIQEIIRATGWTPSELARRAHVSHTTLTRFLNNGVVTWTLSSRTLDKIRQAARDELTNAQLEAFWVIAQRGPPP